MPPAGLEPTISEDERPQTCALDPAATGTGKNAYSNAELVLSRSSSYVYRKLSNKRLIFRQTQLFVFI
jgi:hypothetical protein